MRTIARASVPLITHQMARKGKFSGSEVKMKEEAVIFILFYFFLLFGYIILGFTGGSACKESVCNAGDLGLIPGLGRSPGVGHGNPLQYSCLENPHGQRSLAGYSSWGCKELDTTEQLTPCVSGLISSCKNVFF